MNRATVSIIIPCYNQVRCTQLCIGSILKYTDHPYELIAVDNGSSDSTRTFLSSLQTRLSPDRYPALRRYHCIANDVNAGVSAALNQGIKAAKGDFVCYLNNDTVVTTGWLQGLVRCAQSDPRIGIAGCFTNWINSPTRFFPDVKGFRSVRELQRTAAAVALARKGQYRETVFVHGFCMLIKREAVERIGEFDERFYPCGGDDLDYCMRALRAGYSLVNSMDVFVFHSTSKATLSKQFNDSYRNIDVVTKDSRGKLVEKWGAEGIAYLDKLGLSR